MNYSLLRSGLHHLPLTRL
ncbi:unnamed protein product, partial [Rotaria sp. Silwood2]